MALTKDQKDRLFGIHSFMERMFGSGLGDDEIRRAIEMSSGITAPPPLGLAPTPSGVPLTGFQGTSAFPNQVGSGIMPMSPAGALLMPPIGEQRLDESGNPVPPPGVPPIPPGGTALAQAPRFRKTIQIGEDDQIESVLLKRAIQKQRGLA